PTDVNLVRSCSLGAFFSLKLKEPLSRFFFNASPIFGWFKSLLPDSSSLLKKKRYFKMQTKPH
ncbi:MAG: hypothetical protein K5829_04710, partial [Treponema sp.]|nr:hypothetical protein [Treponema sp.]